MVIYLIITVTQGMFILRNSTSVESPLNTIVRFDRISPFSNLKKYQSFHPSPVTGLKGVSKAELLPDDAFKVRLTCASGISTSLCIKVEQGLKSAGKRLLQNLRITRQVSLTASFKSFCAGENLVTCERRNLVFFANIARRSSFWFRIHH